MNEVRSRIEAKSDHARQRLLLEKSDTSRPREKGQGRKFGRRAREEDISNDIFAQRARVFVTGCPDNSLWISLIPCQVPTARGHPWRLSLRHTLEGEPEVSSRNRQGIWQRFQSPHTRSLQSVLAHTYSIVLAHTSCSPCTTHIFYAHLANTSRTHISQTGFKPHGVGQTDV
jgi:hypothetical protein